MVQESCNERIDRHYKSRIEDLRLMFDPQPEDCSLSDNGTLDTVICIGDREFIYSDTSDYRDDETGEMDLDAFLDDNFDDIRNDMYEDFYDYGLSFDYVPIGTFNDQHEGYFRYQISWGGPSEEFRFFCGPDYNPYKIEFWFLDWGDGACKRLYGNDLDILMQVWDQFKDTGTAQAEFVRATE